MEIGRQVLEHLHTMAQQLGIQRMGGHGGYAVVHLALQQQAHAHAAPRGIAQCAPEGMAGIEIRRDQVDSLTRSANRIDVGAFDHAALAQVVSQDKGRADRGQVLPLLVAALAPRQAHAAQQAAQARHRLAAAHQGEQLLAKVAAQPGARPDRAGRLLHRLHHRAAQGHGEVQPRRVGGPVVEIDAVIDDVDAADKGLHAIHHAKLLMQPAQLPGLQPAPPAVDGAEHRQRHLRPLQLLAQPIEAGLGTETVHHHAHAHTARGSGAQLLDQHSAGRIVMKDVGGQPDFMARGGNGRGLGRKELVATAQQAHLVAAEELGQAGRVPVDQRLGVRFDAQPVAHGSPSSSSATSGRWSDMRTQAPPRGTCMPTQCMPRM